MSDTDSLTSELDDSDDALSGYPWARLDFARLLRPAVIRRVLGIVVALVVVSWPERTVLIGARLLGVGLIVDAVPSLWSKRRVRPVRWPVAAWSLAALGVGLFLAVFPARTEAAFGRISGAVLVVAGVVRIAEVVRTRREADLGWKLASSLLLIAVGGLVSFFSAELLSTVTIAAAFVWIAVEFLALSVLLDPDRDADAPATTSQLVARWFADRPKTVDDRERLYSELLYESDRAPTKIVRFVALMTFAAVIASAGVVAESTAVVIGAMLIAPLMTPLMGMALSLVMGWPNRLKRSSLVALTGVAIAIGVGFVIGRADFSIIDTLTNDQIVSRASPTIIDLVIAVAAGAAGAYGWSRPDVSNTLPGVGVAIALVPPLTVVGLSYSQGDAASGNGALLLFVINAIAILVAGAIVFVLTGIAPLSRVRENQHRVRTSVAAVGVGAAIITGALLVNGTGRATNLFEKNAVSRAVDAWVAGHPEHTTVRVDLSGDDVSVVLAGPALDNRPSAKALADDLTAELGRDIIVELRILLEIQETSEG